MVYRRLLDLKGILEKWKDEQAEKMKALYQKTLSVSNMLLIDDVTKIFDNIFDWRGSNIR